MKKTIKLLFTAIGFMFLHSCSLAQRNVDGGPCSYETTNHPAVIVMIFPVVDSLTSDMLVVANNGWQKDTLMFSDAARSFMSNEEINMLNLKVGDTLNYKHKEIISGSCTPDIWFLTKERYKK